MSLVTLRELAAEFKMDRSALGKTIRKMKLEIRTVRTLESRGQMERAVSPADAARLRERYAYRR